MGILLTPLTPAPLRTTRSSNNYESYHPLLASAIVVSKPNVDFGRMEPDGTARLLGYAVTDEEAFLKEQQAPVCASAKENPPCCKPAGVG